MRSEEDIRQVVEDLKWARSYYGGSGSSTVMLTAEITALDWALGEPDIVGKGSYEELREKRAKIERAATN